MSRRVDGDLHGARLSLRSATRFAPWPRTALINDAVPSRHSVARPGPAAHIRGMTSRTTRVLTATVASLLAAASLGCGLLDQAKDLVGTAQVLSSFADRLGKAAELTYTADYQVTGGTTVTLVQQPPNAAFIAARSRFISTPETLYVCSSEMGDLTCQKTANQAAAVAPRTRAWSPAPRVPGSSRPRSPWV